jgi:hypothetical protein
MWQAALVNRSLEADAGLQSDQMPSKGQLDLQTPEVGHESSGL